MLFDEMTDILMMFVTTKIRPIFTCPTFYTGFQSIFLLFK